MGYGNRDEGAITRRVHLNEFAFPNLRRMGGGAVNIGDYVSGIGEDSAVAGRVETILFIMIGVRAVEMMCQAELHQDNKQRYGLRHASVGLLNHGYLQGKP